MAGEIARAFVRIVPNSTGFESTLARQTKGVGGRVGGTIGKAMAVGIGGAVAVAAGGLAAATKLAIGFDKAMRNVNSIAKLNEQDFGALNKRVLDLAKSAGVGPSTLAAGLYDVVSSGFAADDAMKILTAGARAAKAGLTDTATATGAVTSVLNAYHLSADQAGKVSDALFQTVNVGVINFEQLASNIGDVLPFASSLGINIQNVGAAIATMTKEGISGAETVTRIKAVMSQFLSPSKDLAKAIKAQGFESGEAMIKAKGFQGALDILSKATHGSKTEMAKLFPDIRALGGALALTGANADTAHKDLEALARSQGATASAAKEQAKSISQQWDKAVGRLQASAIVLGAQVLPVISEGIGLFAKLADAVGVFASKPTIKLKAEFALDEILSAAGQIRDAVAGAIDDALNGSSFTPTGTFNSAVGMVSTEGLLAKVDQIDWGAVGAKIVAGITTALAATSDVWGTMIDGLTTAVDTHQAQIAGAGAKIALGIVSALLDPSFWVQNWQLILGIAIAVFPVARLGSIGVKIAALFKGFGGPIARAFETGLLAVGIAVERFGGRLGGWLVDAVLAALRAVSFVARGLGAGIAEMVGAGVSGVKGIVGKLLKVGVVAAIVGAVGSAVSAAVSLGGKIVHGVESGLATIFSAVVNAMASVGNAVANAATSAYNAAVSLGASIVNGIIAGVASLPGRLASKVAELAKGAISAAAAAIGAKSPSKMAAERVGEPMVSGIVMGIERNKKKISVTLTAAARQAVSDAKQNLLSLAGGIGDSVGSIIDAQIKKKTAPLQAELAAMQQGSAAEDQARQRADLASQVGGGLNEGESIAEFLKRQEDARQALADFDRDAQKAATEQALQDRIDAIQTEADARKESIGQQIADATAKFNAGIFNGTQLTAALSKILTDNGASIGQAGQLLGFAFAEQFKAQIADVTKQILDLASVLGLKGGTAGGAGFAGMVVDPLAEIRGQMKDKKGEVSKDRTDLAKDLTKLSDAQKALHDATTARQRESAQKRIRDAQAEVAKDRRELAKDRALVAALAAILKAAERANVGTITVTAGGVSSSTSDELADLATAAAR